MDIDNYLKIFNLFISDNRLYELEVLTYFNSGIEVKSKEIEFKKINSKLILTRLNIGFNKYFLVKSSPLDMYVNLGIFIGSNCKLYEFSLNSDIINSKNKSIISSIPVYIGDIEILEILKLEIDQNTIKQINPNSLNGLTYSLNFIQPEIISQLKKFTYSSINLDLNKFHIMDFDKIILFQPNIYKSHYNIAIKLNFPLSKLFPNGFIKDSTINIFDVDFMIKQINPFLIFDEEIYWPFKKNSNNRLYKDLEEKLILKIRTNKLLRLIEKSTVNNIEKDILKSEIIKINKIFLSTKNSRNSNFSKNLFIPLFKSVSNQNYLNYSSREDFFKIAGVNFRLDREYLSNIFIQTLTGEKTQLKDYYLNSKLTKIFKNLNLIEDNKVFFNSILELVIKLELLLCLRNYIPSNVKIVYISPITNSNLIKFKNILKKVLKKNILTTINYNKLPTFITNKSLLDLYYLSKLNSIYSEYIKYRHFEFGGDKLLIEINKHLDEIKLVQKNIFLKYSNLFIINQIIILILDILKEFDSNSAYKFKELFENYFYNIKFDLIDFNKYNLNNNSNINFEKSKINKKLENEIFIIALYNRLGSNLNKNFSKKIVLLNLKNDNSNLDYYNSLLFKNLKIYSSDDFNFKRVIKLNIHKIKKIFPYSYNQIIKQLILQINLNNDKEEILNHIDIKIKNRKIHIDNSYFNYVNYYFDFKIIRKSNSLLLLKSKN